MPDNQSVVTLRRLNAGIIRLLTKLDNRKIPTEQPGSARRRRLDRATFADAAGFDCCNARLRRCFRAGSVPGAIAKPVEFPARFVTVSTGRRRGGGKSIIVTVSARWQFRCAGR
jgi:hypothetical protein